jgi:origin recognition complex subunit 5
VYAELATLRRLRLIVPSAAAALSGGGSGSNGAGGGGGAGGTGNSSADVGEKWCINVSGDWIRDMAKEIGVEVGEWLAGGLD